ncbi:MAG: miaB 2 [Firmicutes bacterium]|nr:miaB 2 [Bacillota bacterium]
MAIAVSVAIKLKVRGYVAAKDDFSLATVDMMALFEVPEIEALATSIPANTIKIESTVIDGNTPAVRTVLKYADDQEKVRVLEEVSKPAGSGERYQTAVRRLIRLNIFKLMYQITGYTPGPWGIMRGVRPTKLVHRLLDEGLDSSQVIGQLSADYAVSQEKARLLTDIALRQRPFLLSPEDKRRVSLYIGIPYCLSRCLYCSFPSAVIPDNRQDVVNLLAALETDILAAAAVIEKYDLIVDSLYIGGGTPTSLNEEDFGTILNLVKSKLVMAATREFTVEAGRPDSTNEAKILAMYQAGVTRISVNPQTMQEKTLKLIGRNHNVRDIISMFQKIRQIGIAIINMDIIIGLPGENEADLKDTLEQIAALAPDNLTVHTLALKRGSRLMESAVGLSLSQKGLASKQLVIADHYAAKMGMVPYYLYRQKNMAGNLENVGYTLPGKECLYNIQIIDERQTIIGIGPTAATKAIVPGDHKLSSSYNPKDIRSYINNLNTHLQRREALLANLFKAKEE